MSSSSATEPEVKAMPQCAPRDVDRDSDENRLLWDDVKEGLRNELTAAGPDAPRELKMAPNTEPELPEPWPAPIRPLP